MHILYEISIQPVYSLAIVGLLVTILIAYLVARLVNSEKSKYKAELKYRELEDRISAIQLENIESKLNPHLFKNILNSIQSHAYQTYFAIDKLANVLDYILYESRKKFVSPKEEVEFALNLIEINKIKVSPLFEIHVKVKVNESDPLYGQKVLSPLITVDFIENAFKHADLQSPDSFISFVFELSDKYFSITVANKISSKTPMKKEHSGIGAELLEKRLRFIYKDSYKLDRFIDGDVYNSHLKINLLEHKAQMLASR